MDINVSLLADLLLADGHVDNEDDALRAAVWILDERAERNAGTAVTTRAERILDEWAERTGRRETRGSARTSVSTSAPSAAH